jgi:HK97 gp10 family phage protein
VLTVKVDGLRQIEKAMMELKPAAAKAVTRRVAKKALQPIADKAKSLAPEDEGNLRDAISVSTKARKGMQKPDAVNVFVGVATSEGRVAVNQEYGNEDHAAQPFMRPAWEGGKMKVLSDFKDGMTVEVGKSVQRARRKAAKP